MSDDETSQFLAHVSLFKNVKAEYLPSIAKRLEEKVFAKDVAVFNEGDDGETLYVIKQGAASVLLIDPVIGLKYELARLRTGQVFGEMALLGRKKRSATVKTTEPTSCLLLDRNTLMAIVERVPQVGLAIAEVLAERVEQLNKERGQAQVQIDDLTFDPGVYRMVPPKILERHRMIPLNVKNGVLTLACADPDDLAGIDEVRRILRGVEIHPIAIRDADYSAFVKKHAASLPPPEASQRARSSKLLPVSWISEDAKSQKALEGKGDEVKLLVDMIISQAVDLEASDIHIEPELDFVNVRFRVSGGLVKRPGPPIPKAYHRPIASRIKVLADLDISEKRRPQDGRITCKVGEKQYDLRVSSMPTHEGEKVVMRVLDTASAVQPLEKLILAEKVCRVVHQMVSRPYGIVFVTGPTGSGKTTTLYSAVGLRRREDTNIVTVEDPVEYNLPGITQVSVHPEIGLTFASVLRSFLRQDPNVILVGETRDQDTGKIALEAGLTGHLVLTSLHTNDAIGTIQRLREMKLENYAIASALVGVISQRLVRRLCPVCAQDAPASPHVLEQLALSEVLPRGWTGTLKRTRGCETCSGTGYRGRVGVYEILVADDDLRQEIIRDSDHLRLREVALKSAYVPMVRYSNYLLTNGITTPEEILGIHAGRPA